LLEGRVNRQGVRGLVAPRSLGEDTASDVERR
jgi:hypothetical protein